MFNMILFGPPGSGKGTQSAKIINQFNLRHISTGDLLRDEVSRETILGLEAKKYMDQGMLVPDEVVIGMISAQIDAHPEAAGFVFDGFPRTKAQAEALDKLLEFKNTQINVLLSLDVDEAELKRRLIDRGTVSGRSDDNEEVITKRIQEYHNKTAPVEAYYDTFGKVVKVAGVGTVEEIFTRLSREIESHLPEA